MPLCPLSVAILTTQYNFKAMINLIQRLKYLDEDTRDMPATREHRTSATRRLLPSQGQPAGIMGVVMQVTGQDETLRQSPGEDTRPHPDRGWQEDQGPEVRWTIARLLGQEEKILIPNSEPTTPIASHSYFT